MVIIDILNERQHKLATIQMTTILIYQAANNTGTI